MRTSTVTSPGERCTRSSGKRSRLHRRPPVGAGVAEDTVSAAESASRKRIALSAHLTTPALLGLPIGWLAVFFVAPIAIVAAYSVDVLTLFPGSHGFTLSAWHAFLHSSVYLRQFWSSVKLSLTVSAVVVALAYPLAYYLALSGTKRKYVLLLLLIAPFLTSYLLRVLAWKVLLGDEGPRNTLLTWIGLPPISLIYTRFAVMLV